MVDELSALLIGRTSILGSQLGQLIPKVDGSFNARTYAGGLKGYVSDKLSDILIFTEKRGLDDLYAVVAAEHPIKLRLDGHSASLWQIFSNPNTHGFILFDNLDRGLYLVATKEKGDVRNFIRKLSTDDYRALADRHLEGLPPELKDEWVRISDRPDFSSQWYAFLRRHNLLREWEERRIDYIEAFFRDQLNSTGATIEEIETCLVQLRQSRAISEAHRRAKGSREVGQERLRVAGSDSKLDDLSPQRLLALVAGKLTEEEARRVLLPLGAILDALARK